MTKTQTEVLQIFPFGTRGPRLCQTRIHCSLRRYVRSLDEAWDEHSLEASDDEASVDDAIVVALNDMDGAAPSRTGDPIHMDVQHR